MFGFRCLFFWSVIGVCPFINLHLAQKKTEKEKCDSDYFLFNTSAHEKEQLEYTNFQSNIVKYLRKFAKKYNAQLNWYDIDGEHVKENAAELGQHYEKYKVTSYSGPTFYEEGIKCLRSSTQVEDELRVCNPHPENAKSFTPPPKLIALKNDISWTVKKALKIDAKKIGFKIEMPDGVMFETGKETVPVDSTHDANQNQKSIAYTHGYTIEQHLNVDPDTELIVRYITTKEEVELPFVTELYLEGYVLANFSQKIHGRALQIYPVTAFASNLFLKRGDALVFNCTGTFRGARGITTEIDYNEWPYKTENKEKCHYVL